MTTWYPIETAPKDGSIVRLRDKDQLYNYVMAWNKAENRWHGLSFGILGSSKTTWDEVFAAIHEWAPVES